MANTKISQLPSWTGSAADLRWFVMNNSGETETFKFSGWTSPIRTGSGSNSIISNYFTTSSNASVNGVLLGGANTNSISSTGNYNSIIGGEGSTITAGEDNGLFAAKNSTIGTSASYSAVIGGRTHTVNNQFAFIGGGAQNTAGYLSATLGGFNANASNQSTVINGESNTSSAAYGVICGGVSNTNNAGNYCSIYNSQSSTISSTNVRNTIIASNNSTITGTTTQAVMIGVSGRTATTSYATFVENLVVFNYAGLNFANDADAAAGGVVLGQVYHNAGALRIRIS